MPTDKERIKMIPKRIFTIWLNEDSKMPDLVESCLASQRAVKGYKHSIITLENYPKGIPYLDAAIATKKWVRASDFLRIIELISNGGIYCDTDIEILPGKNFDDMLDCSFFASYEKNKFIATCLMGSIPQNQMLKQHIEEVLKNFKGDQENMDGFEAAQAILTPRIYQGRRDDPSVHIYPPEFFIPYDHISGQVNITENTRTFHHFMKSSDYLYWPDYFIPKSK